MAIECGVITGIFALFAFVFFKYKHKQWAYATFPLAVLPLTDFVLELVVIKAMHIQVTAFGGILTLVIAVAAAAAWIGAVSNGLKSKKTRLTYISISNAFNILLAAILISDILSRAGNLDAQIIVK